jgi:hypothetical protein
MKGYSNMKLKSILGVIGATLLLTGCGSQDIPQAHKGRMFDKTGALALWAGGKGFEGDILGPGTYYTGVYNEVRMIDCGQRTVKEGMVALTKDGVQFSLDVYVRYGANCDDNKAVEAILGSLSPSATQSANPQPDPADKANSNTPQTQTQKDDPDPVEKNPDLTITSRQIYITYIRPTIGEAVRESVSHYIANEVNAKRDQIFEEIKTNFDTRLKTDPKLVQIYSLNLSNLNFPDEMVQANTDRAVQSVLKDKAIAERERVQAEIETTNMRKQLAQSEAANDVARIDAIGAALKRNPEYLQFDMQQKMPDIYAKAADKGALIIAAPSPNLQLQISQPMVRK